LLLSLLLRRRQRLRCVSLLELAAGTAKAAARVTFGGHSATPIRKLGLHLTNKYSCLAYSHIYHLVSSRVADEPRTAPRCTNCAMPRPRAAPAYAPGRGTVTPVVLGRGSGLCASRAVPGLQGRHARRLPWHRKLLQVLPGHTN
jgi:hypothetical protein